MFDQKSPSPLLFFCGYLKGKTKENGEGAYKFVKCGREEVLYFVEICHTINPE